MYCPKCGTNNLEGAKFCRACGSDISLVPQAMTGRLPEYPPAEPDAEAETHGRHRRRRPRKEPTIEEGIKSVFIGIGFLLVALSVALFAPAGRLWWFWMLIPAFASLGGGVAGIMRAKRQQSYPLPAGPTTPALPPPARVSALPSRNTGEIVSPPPSVTEGTTRRLGAEGPTRHFGAPLENPRKDV